MSEINEFLDGDFHGFPGPFDFKMYSDANRFFCLLPFGMSLFDSLLVAFDSSLKVRRPDDELGYL